MKKSSAVNFVSFGKQVNEYDSGDSDDDNDFADTQESSLFNPVKTKSQLFTVDVAQMISLHKIPLETKNSPSHAICISDSEYFLEKFNCPLNPGSSSRIEPLECVVVNVAHLEQFPKPTSSFSATLPSIFTWTNTNTSFSSEYPTMIQNYFKSAYQQIRQKIKFFFSIAPNTERLRNLSSIRREGISGRVLFHYIGYGFPKIEKNKIWCSDRRSTDFKPYDISALFQSLMPPTWFIFDCSNAAVVIPQFEETAAKLSQRENNPNWNNWVCVCATDVDEQLPDDPRLPKDFLTSCILSPLKMGIVCHLLQHYRTNLVGPNFPNDLPCANLLKDPNPLNSSLSAIIDAIASDSLPDDLYHKIFRVDRSSAVIFRHVLLAQFLLRPYRVHPVTHPSLPDLSMHPLWKQWSVLLDNAICSVSIPRKPFTTELFNSVAQSMQTILKNKQFSLVRPYHLTLLFHMIYAESKKEPLLLFAEYAASPEMNPDMLCNATVFYALFRKMIDMDPTSPAFHPICYLIVTLLFYKPSFASDIHKELDVSKFPALVFNKNLKESTRVLVDAIVATLAVCTETFQQICTTLQYLSDITSELGNASPQTATWLLLIVRRAFHLYSPDPAVYVTNGLHVQCSVHLFNRDPAVRAAALSALACFMRPFECNVNGQLLFLALPVLCDASYLVRFHFVLLLKKFVTSFENYSDSVNPDPSFSFDDSSFNAIVSSCFPNREVESDSSKVPLTLISKASTEFFEAVDNEVQAQGFIKRAYAIAMALLSHFSNDPQPSVSELANRVIKYISHSRTEYDQAKTIPEDFSSPSSLQREHFVGDVMSYGGEDEEFEEEHFTFANIDQNESLHEICLHDLVLMREWQPTATTNVSKEMRKSLPPAGQERIPQTAEFIPLSTFKASNEEIKHIAFHRDSLGVACSTNSEVIFINDQKKRTSIPIPNGAVTDLHVVNWREHPEVLFATNDGCVHLWSPNQATLTITFRVEPSSSALPDNTFISPSIIPYRIYTTCGKSQRVCSWDLNSQRILGEWETGAQAETTSILTDPNNTDSIICGSKNGVLRELGLTDPTACAFLYLSAQHPNFSIKRIECWKSENCKFFLAINNGLVDTWTPKNDITALLVQHEMKLHDFRAHRLYPVLIYSPEDAAPFATNHNGEVIHTFKNIGDGTVCVCHPLLPVFGFGAKTGDVIIYQLAQKE